MADRAKQSSVIRRLGPTGLLGIAWAVAPALCGFYLLAKIDPVSQWIQSHGDLGAAVYVGAFIISAGFGLLPTYAQAILGGWVLGFAVGLPAALIGFTGAALVGYGISRLVSRDRVEKMLEENVKARAVREALIGRGFARTLGLVALLRCPPNSPFALTNLLMASAGVAMGPYVMGTMIGMIPRTAVAVGLAHAAATTGAKDIQSFVKDGPGPYVLIGGIVVLFIALGIIGTIAQRAIDRAVRGSGGASPAKPAARAGD
jgi:uncharacterized membrane protein YdjX (TVP38/TMEM64 family)